MDENPKVGEIPQNRIIIVAFNKLMSSIIRCSSQVEPYKGTFYVFQKWQLGWPQEIRRPEGGRQVVAAVQQRRSFDWCRHRSKKQVVLAAVTYFFCICAAVDAVLS